MYITNSSCNIKTDETEKILFIYSVSQNKSRLNTSGLFFFQYSIIPQREFSLHITPVINTRHTVNTLNSELHFVVHPRSREVLDNAQHNALLPGPIYLCKINLLILLIRGLVLAKTMVIFQMLLVFYESIWSLRLLAASMTVERLHTLGHFCRIPKGTLKSCRRFDPNVPLLRWYCIFQPHMV